MVRWGSVWWLSKHGRRYTTQTLDDRYTGKEIMMKIDVGVIEKHVGKGIEEDWKLESLNLLDRD